MYREGVTEQVAANLLFIDRNGAVAQPAQAHQAGGSGALCQVMIGCKDDNGDAIWRMQSGKADSRVGAASFR